MSSLTRNVRLALAPLVILLCVSYAMEAQAKPRPSPSPSPTGTVQKEADADDLITNNKLRALSGSKSKWSFASAFNYLGGTMQKPFDQDRPNISGASGTTTKADLDGSISAKFAINSLNSLMMGVGVRWIAPLSFGPVVNYTGNREDISNPYVQYQLIYKWLDIQSVFQVSVAKFTQADETHVGYDWNFGVDQENVLELGKSGLSVGVSTVVQTNTFNKTSVGSPGESGYIADLAPYQSQWGWDLAFYLEYQITDKINFRTLINPLNFEHYSEYPDGPKADGTNPYWYHDTTYQSIGLGFSVTRDIFLYPNIQFLPQKMQSALTNCGISATVNLF